MWEWSECTGDSRAGFDRYREWGALSHDHDDDVCCRLSGHSNSLSNRNGKHAAGQVTRFWFLAACGSDYNSNASIQTNNSAEEEEEQKTRREKEGVWRGGSERGPNDCLQYIPAPSASDSHIAILERCLRALSNNTFGVLV